MYKDTQFYGTTLPAETLCLTYDDGPGETPGVGAGPHTLKLAEYLHDQGIRVTFFVTGKHAERFPHLLPQIQALGHLIGNHTFSHPRNLDTLLRAGGDVIDEVARTDALIKPWIDGPITYVRPPYGSWSPGVAHALNNNMGTALDHFGPINWDIDAKDFQFWLDGKTPESCAAAYLNDINALGHGIVLMHDSTADMDTAKDKNWTCAMTQILVPQLLSQGYGFRGIDEIPEIQATAQAGLQCALLASNGKYVSPQQGGGGGILVDGPAVGDWEPLGVSYLAPGKVALTAKNGLYLSPQNGGNGEVLANGPALGAWEPFDLVPVGDGKVAFRTVTGHYLTRETPGGGRLMANVVFVQEWESFSFVNLSI